MEGRKRSERDLVRIKLRDNLVRARVGVMNAIRSTIKSLGYKVPTCSSEHLHKVVKAAVPDEVSMIIGPSVEALEQLSLRIKVLEREIKTVARSKYPATERLQQIPGVGPITALYFVLKIEDPLRFKAGP